MIYKRFLYTVFVAFLLNGTIYAQFDLIKDFDGGTKSSFSSDFSEIVYSIGSKVLVQYDSVAAGQYTGKSSLSSVDMSGNSQRLASAASSNDMAVFFDFRTLPDGKVAFIVMESSSSFKIIITDGTTAGTVTAYTSAYAVIGLEVIDNGLYFTYDGNPNHALMKIDLITLNVTQVVEFGYFHIISDISKVSNSTLIFMAPNPADNSNQTLYVSDGTSAGTTALTVINTGSEFSQNTVMTQVGNKVYFFYKRPGSDCCNDLWVTDGTVTGTKKLKEFNIVFFVDYVRAQKMIAFNDKFYFSGVANGGNTNNDEVLWVSDGTTAGTIALTDPSESRRPRNLLVFKNKLYFIAYNEDVYDYRLYMTDGVDMAGTSKVALKYDTYNLGPYSMAADADYIYLATYNVNASFDAGLVRFDGSNTQVELLEEDNNNQSVLSPDNLYVNGSDLYFTANLSTASPLGTELYTSGGNFTSGGTTATTTSVAVSYVVYPNPAKDQITVKSPEQIISLRLINQLGSTVARTDASSLDVASYPAGVYYLEVIFSTNEVSYQKVILNK